MVTPFDSDLNVSLDKAANLAQHLVTSGSEGIVVGGTTGESPTLTHDEKINLFRCIKDTVGENSTIIAGTGNYNTAESIDLTKAAEIVGVNAVMLVTPYYNKPSQEGLYQHFKTVAGATSLPVILYNVPSRTGRNIDAATTLRLAHEVDNIVGIKEASADLGQIAEIASNAPANFGIWSGNDDDTLHILALGGLGVISVASHITGLEIQEMIATFLNGDLATATEIHLRLLPFINAIFPPASPNPCSIKAACNMVGLDVGGLRLPLVAISSAEADTLHSELAQLSKFKNCKE